jgi:ergothioneine biosynthesis protein EgtB
VLAETAHDAHDHAGRLFLTPRPDDQAVLTMKTAPPGDDLAARYRAVRATTEKLCAPLETEDYVVQSMPDASPAKWHLAHTTWFFETFLLKAESVGRQVSPEAYSYIFNSYYNALGERIARASRGVLSRPTVAEVYHYRSVVDAAVLELLATAGAETLGPFTPRFVLGLNHEQQHQELILTDLKHLFASNPVRPAYREGAPALLPAHEAPPLRWVPYPGGVGEIGFAETGFAFDNESPRHRVFVEPHALASRLATNVEYLAFIEDGGYARPEFWLSDGWSTRQAESWSAPLYWEKTPGGWQVTTLAGVRALSPDEPVCHISFYEADAFARWSGARLPTEAEWELAAESVPVVGNFLESEQFHPRPPVAGTNSAPLQLFGDVWEWTGSPYTPYPGFRPAEGVLGEYNGKFMCNQMVLRGGSCASPRSHIRSTYRNFFPPAARWQFSGIRLAQDA